MVGLGKRRGIGPEGCSVKRISPSVGASLLAKNVNDNACFLIERGACEFFASKLAPTKSIGSGIFPETGQLSERTVNR
ncbi:hypothetical protein [Pseudomonas sp. 24 E 13]|jgi:hypothetical protein|nr:hypothetical protein [Pseudomonas sp. 24 E 13]CRN00125.1 hypothetical protein [Pseudomonas sp. 34 E 7]